ncbi:MAG: segregation/condensation protein A [Oscillospiraceae bacterium]|nr:segregation/condensation protein A [Oscillospiraceae bacterium]
MEKLTFSVAEYDAPLDLILHLLQKNKLSILDIEISALLEQYMAAISQLGEQDLEVASEFLEMASRLVHIKTVSLLPKHKEEEDRLKQELQGQLIEYALCKAAARDLGELYLGQDIFVRQAVRIEIDPTYTLTHEAQVLADALIDAMGKEARRLPPPKEVFDPLVTRPVISVTAKIFTILRALRQGGPAHLQDIYRLGPDRSGMVATFLAVLELIKAGKVCLEGEEVQLTGDS